MATEARVRMAQALAKSKPDRHPADYDSEGLQAPAIDPIMLLAGAAGPALARALASMGRSAPRILASQAGAIFPENTAPELLPAIAKGAKTGDPHALFAYTDDFGPGMTKRAIYNVFGDPNNPVLKEAGWGSSLPVEMLKKFGIPITGKQL